MHKRKHRKSASPIKSPATGSIKIRSTCPQELENSLTLGGDTASTATTTHSNLFDASRTTKPSATTRKSNSRYPTIPTKPNRDKQKSGMRRGGGRGRGRGELRKDKERVKERVQTLKIGICDKFTHMDLPILHMTHFTYTVVGSPHRTSKNELTYRSNRPRR